MIFKTLLFSDPGEAGRCGPLDSVTNDRRILRSRDLYWPMRGGVGPLASVSWRPHCTRAVLIGLYTTVSRVSHWSDVSLTGLWLAGFITTIHCCSLYCSCELRQLKENIILALSEEVWRLSEDKYWEMNRAEYDRMRYSGDMNNYHRSSYRERTRKSRVSIMCQASIFKAVSVY